MEDSVFMTTTNQDLDNIEETQAPEIDSKYRLIILAAKRSKQLQRGARPRIEIDPVKHKPTRIALEEVIRGRVNFSVKDGDDKSEPV
jgi:DNA-directed RNA polymerase omega subunit